MSEQSENLFRYLAIEGGSAVNVPADPPSPMTVLVRALQESLLHAGMAPSST